MLRTTLAVAAVTLGSALAVAPVATATPTVPTAPATSSTPAAPAVTKEKCREGGGRIERAGGRFGGYMCRGGEYDGQLIGLI
jgi:hypothetical protein